MAIEPAVHELLERELELELVAALVEAAGRGRGGLVLFEGSPGVGKTALIERATAIAREQGFAVLRARGHELERAFGWGVARSLLELPLARDPERDDLLAGPAAPARAILDAGAEAPASEPGFAILHALYWLVARIAERGPLLVAVDDAQWADEPSLRFLLYLAGRLSEHPIAVVVGARAAADELITRLGAGPDAQVQDPLVARSSAVAALVRERLGDADDELCERCFALTAGNPLEVRALLAAMERQPRPALAAAAEQAADSLASSVRRRLAALSPNAQALARAVAVFEDDAPLHLAAVLTGLPSAAALVAAGELAHADVLREGDPLGFTHPLLRAAVYSGLPLGERARTHRLAARVLIDAGASGERVSAHLLESGPAGDDAAVGLLRATAQRALAQGVPASAVRYLERALREPPADADRPAVLAELGRAEAAAGLPDAVAHLEAAIGLAGGPRQRAALRLVLGRVLQDGGSLGDACARIRAWS